MRRWRRWADVLREFHLDNPRQYFTDYVRRYTDMPMLVMLEERDGYYAQVVCCALPISLIRWGGK